MKAGVGEECPALEMAIAEVRLTHELCPNEVGRNTMRAYEVQIAQESASSEAYRAKRYSPKAHRCAKRRVVKFRLPVLEASGKEHLAGKRGS